MSNNWRRHNWRKVRLGDAPLQIIDGDRGKNYPSQNDFYDDEYCLFLNTKNVRRNGFDFSVCQYITEQRDKLLRKGKLQRNDLVLTTRGTIGNLALYTEKTSFENIRINSGMVIIRPDETKLNSVFNYYLFRKSQDDFAVFTTGSAQPQLPIKDLIKMPIFLPPLPTQRAIAATLSCLDDKIELNNRINANLEAQAQAIFKSWFVDFEPWKGGNFVESELGRIPKGWRVGTVGDLGTVTGGATPSKEKHNYFTMPGKGISWITPKDLSINKNKFVSFGEIDITEEGYKNCSTKLMPEGTVLFSSRAPIGYIAIASKELCTNQGFKSITPNSGIGTAYVYYWLKTNLDIIESHASGSTFKEISGNIMKNIAVTIPNVDTLSKFNDVCNQIFNLQDNNEKQSRALAAIRDALLPKLMSGDIEVEE